MKKNLLIFLTLFLCSLASFAQDAIKGEIDAFASKTGALPSIDRATGSLSFLRFPAGRALQVRGEDAQQKSTNFVSENSKIYGLRSDSDEYRLRGIKTDTHGFENVTLQQTYKGVPVFDGLMKFHYNKDKNLTSVNGNFISEIKVNPVPTLAQHEAEAIAIKYVTSDTLIELAAPLKANKSTIYIFQKGLAQGYRGPKYLVYEVEVRNDLNVREFLYIDAHSGELIERFTGMHNIIHRVLYETSITVPNKKWEEGELFPGTLDQWQQSEVETSGFIYNLMKNTFNYASYNGADAPMITINNNPTINCPNANWNGVSANYCTGTASDDVVAHEWGHAYTEYTSGLIYAWQAGAMNEAYSDIWGETVDLLDNYMDAGESIALRNDVCGTATARWQVGEKATSFVGGLRDMWNPTCKGSPGKVSDSQYWCYATDQGGVHFNSGVLNHAYALLVDGGTYNGQTITGLGLVKAAHIFWRAQTEYMTATTDFAAQADILEASLDDLIGADLLALSTGTGPVGISGEKITLADAAQLAKVLLAVELRSDNTCGFTPLLQPVAGLCEGAKPGQAIFFENFETGLGGFTASFSTSSGSWIPRNWVQADAPAGRPGKVAFGPDLDAGNCASSVQSGIIRMESPLINIPAGTAGTLSMAFDHYVSIEQPWDGANIKYSINGGGWTLLPASAFTANGYNTFINTLAMGSSNPLAGQPAFSGADGGSTVGSWGQSQINLTSIGLAAGGNIKLRWELGTDGCSGFDGWYVDDIRVYTCAITPAVHFALESASVNEGQAITPSGCLDYVDKIITVQIDKAPSQPVTVTFNTPGGTAKKGPTADYTISPAFVTLQNGSLTQNVTVRVFNDAYVEGYETIDLSYAVNANGGNGYAGTEFQNFQLTIVDDDATPGNYTEVLLSSNFNNGGPSGWTVINGGNNNYTWAVQNYSNAALDNPSGRPFMFVNSNAGGSASLFDEIIESPPINSAGKKNMVLTFLQDWFPYIGAYPDSAIVDIWDGIAWKNVLKQAQTSGRLGDIQAYSANAQTINIPDAYANVNMKVRFRYKASWDYWWAVDNIQITSSNSTGVMTAVNTGSADQQYLGPMETAVFYDPGTGNLMAKIKNLTNHDYGCTTVEVDRAGVDETNWVGPYKITNKTFKVTPTNNNPTGQYEITLYYKSTELPNFNGTDIKSMGKSAGAIGAGNTLGTSFAEVQGAAAFSTDFAYTATFDSGFSGFGLSDAPPAGALPVTLTKFDGKNTAEGNLLSWTTTSEVNNEYFAVEKSLNGKIFNEVGKVTGIGNSSITNTYNFLDVNYPKGITYYRLKQVDFDGKSAHSKIIAIDAINSKAMKFFPNPVQTLLTMELPDPDIRSVNVRVINSAGQQVMEKDKVLIKNGNFNVDLGKLPTGIYQVILSGEKTSYNLSILKL